MRAYTRAILGLSTSLIGISMAMPAMAQDNANSDIIVTARRTEERLQDVPISITVFNQEQLTKRNVTNAEDLARFTPSLSANSNFGSDNSTFALRGFVQDTGTQPSVGVYFADVVMPRGASNGLTSGDGAGPGAFFDLQNLQVLKGPQGTLQGRNTTGGAILLVPQKPTGKFEGYVEGSVGNFDMKRIQAVVNVPVMDTLRIRVGVDRQTRDGYLINTTGIGPRDFNDVDYTALRFSAVADLTPNLENYTIISYTHSRNHGTFQKILAADPTEGLGFFAANQLATAPKGFYQAQQDKPDSYSILEQWQIINTTTWRASDTLTIKNIASYAQLKQDLNNPQFGTYFLLPGTPINFDFAGTAPPPGGHTTSESTATEELQFQGRTADDRLTYQGGAYLEVASPLGLAGSDSAGFSTCSDLANRICAGIPGGFPSNLNYTVAQTSFHDVGVYAQATYKIIDKVKVTGGFRYTWDHETSNDQLISYSGFGLTQTPASAYTCINPLSSGALVDPVTGRSLPQPIANLNGNSCRISLYQHSSAPTWLIDFDYTPVEDLLLYAKYSRGYRAAVINPTLVGAFNYTGAEKVDTYEVGAKTSFHGNVHGYLNAAAFYNDFSNQQTQLGFGSNIVSPAAGPVNLGKSRIWGVEVDGSITPVHGLTLEGGYSHLDTKIRSIPDYLSQPAGPYILGGVPLPGDPLALAPKNKYTVTATYTLPLDESIGKISVGATFTHTDSMLSNYNDKQYVGTAGSDPATVALFQSMSYLAPTDLLNLNASWNSVAGSPVDLSFFMTNVTKEKYYTFLPGLSTTTGFEAANIGAPQMYGFRMRVRFGS
ncbi:MAG TPA: TonB-dependent receptor [Sphingobium sp.]|uniref:TonB-dependent receptor n=1 Tax=Sphingobium sp. TaxID=1912891 RepID=UPI002ED365FC